MTAGERWAAEELGALREARFGPRAWVRFLEESFARAAQTRRSRTALAHQARAWSAVGLIGGLSAATVARRAGVAAPRASAWCVWWLSTAAMLDWHLGMVEGPAGDRREQLTAADALTLARVGVVPFIGAQGPADQAAFAVLLAFAAVTDVADGAVARNAGPTRLGRDLDHAADVLVGAVAVRTARRAGWLHPVIAHLATARHALPIAVVAASYFGAGRRPSAEVFKTMRPTAPVLVGGLIVSPFARRAASALVAAGSLAGLLLAMPRTSATADA